MSNRSKKTKEQIYREAFACMTVGTIPDNIMNGYLNDTDGTGAFKLQRWCVDNMNPGIIDWCTGIGIIEAVELLYAVAMENGNLSIDQ